MIYENCKIYGPYKSKSDGRWRIWVYWPTGKKQYISYPKYLMEKHLDRYLLKNETVDHIDCNFNNNEITNLRILDSKIHASIDALRVIPENFLCPNCHREFVLSGRKLRAAKYNRKRSPNGPFCCKMCAGLFSTKITNIPPVKGTSDVEIF